MLVVVTYDFILACTRMRFSLDSGEEYSLDDWVNRVLRRGRCGSLFELMYHSAPDLFGLAPGI